MKSAHFLLIKNTFSLDRLAELYVKKIVTLHIVPVLNHIRLRCEVYISILEDFASYIGDEAEF